MVANEFKSGSECISMMSWNYSITYKIFGDGMFSFQKVTLLCRWWQLRRISPNFLNLLTVKNIINKTEPYFRVKFCVENTFITAYIKPRSFWLDVETNVIPVVVFQVSTHPVILVGDWIDMHSILQFPLRFVVRMAAIVGPAHNNKHLKSQCWISKKF